MSEARTWPNGSPAPPDWGAVRARLADFNEDFSDYSDEWVLGFVAGADEERERLSKVEQERDEAYAAYRLEHAGRSVDLLQLKQAQERIAELERKDS